MIINNDQYWFHGQSYSGNYDPDKSTYYDYSLIPYFLTRDFSYATIYASNWRLEIYGKVIEYEQTRPLKIFSLDSEDDIQFARDNNFELNNIYNTSDDRWYPDFIDFLYKSAEYDGLYHIEQGKYDAICIWNEIREIVLKKHVVYSGLNEFLTRPEIKKLKNDALTALQNSIDRVKLLDIDKGELTKRILHTTYGSVCLENKIEEKYLKGHLYITYNSIIRLLKNNFPNADWDFLDKELKRLHKIDLRIRLEDFGEE